MIIKALHAWFEAAALPRLFALLPPWVARGLRRAALLPPVVWVGVWAIHVACGLFMLAFRDAATLGLCVSR